MPILAGRGLKLKYKYSCDHCGKVGERKSMDSRTKGVFCGLSCYHKNKKTIQVSFCAHCKKNFTPTARGRKFCSRNCYESSRAAEVCVKECCGCGCSFSVKKSIQHRFNYCSVPCRKKHKGTIKKKCQSCGNAFEHSGSDIRRGLDRVHCSEECRRPVKMITCECCNSSFRAVPSDVGRRFCSMRCYRVFSGETSIEKMVREVLEAEGVKFVQEYSFGRYILDFAILPEMIDIEADGDYWHDGKRDKVRDENMKADGWRVVRLPEHKLKSSNDVKEYVMMEIAAALSTLEM